MSHPPKHSASSRKAARLSGSAAVSLGILLSRILGLVRDKVFAHYLGHSDAAGAFRAALRIPNFLQNLFGEGVLSASFIPVYARLRADPNADPESARAVAAAVGTVLTLVTSSLVLCGVLVAPSFVSLVAPGFTGELQLLTVRMVRILFPGVGLLVLSAWCLGILNSHRHFFLSYVAPVFWNLALICALLFYGTTPIENFSPQLSDAQVSRLSQAELVVVLAWASVLGSFLQFAVQVPFVLRLAGPFRWPSRRDFSNSHVREIFVNLGPVMISRGVVQVSAYIDGMIASFLGAAAVASLAYAQTIYLLPISLFGMAVAAAELPEMSTTGVHPEGLTRLRERLIAGRKRIAFFVVPSLAAIALLGRELVGLLYQSGRFGAEDTRYVWYILIGSSIGLLAATWGRLYSSAFYAMKDTRTPFRFALVRVVCTVGLGLAFAFPLREYINKLFASTLGLPDLPNIDLAMGAVGLAISSGIAGWLECTLLNRSLQRKIGSIAIGPVYLAKTFLSAALAAILALGAAAAFAHWLPHIMIRHEPRAAGIICLYGLFYLSFTITLKLPEALAIVRRFKRS